MRAWLSALLAGLLFGAGLVLSDMVNPARVLAFLDLAGAWDPTLAFVMAAALAPSAIGYALVRRMPRPLAAEAFCVPSSRKVDASLVGGSALFGAGWGLAGFCPGPALAALPMGAWQPWAFAGAMLAGMMLHRLATTPLFPGRPARA